MFRIALLRNDPESRVNRLQVPALSQGVRELEITTCDVQTWRKNGAAPRAFRVQRTRRAHGGLRFERPPRRRSQLVSRACLRAPARNARRAQGSWSGRIIRSRDRREEVVREGFLVQAP